MQYVSPITKDNDIVNKKYVDESVSAVNSEIEKDIENIQAQIGSLTDLETTSKDNLVGAINEVMSNIPDLSEVTSQIGTLENLTTEDKTNLVNAINEVASKGGGVNMTATTLYNGSIVNDTINAVLTDTPDNYDIIYIVSNAINREKSSSTDYYEISTPVFMFPKIGITTGHGGIYYSQTDADSASFNNSRVTYTYSGTNLRINVGGSSADSGTITVYGIKLGG